MVYSNLLKYLDDQACYEDEDGKFPEGSFYHNCINGYICWIQKTPKDEIIPMPALCHIIYELKISPPFDLESDFEVYKLFRANYDKQMASLLNPHNKM